MRAVVAHLDLMSAGSRASLMALQRLATYMTWPGDLQERSGRAAGQGYGSMHSRHFAKRLDIPHCRIQMVVVRGVDRVA